VKALSKESHFLVVKTLEKTHQKSTTRRKYKIFFHFTNLNENDKTYPYEK